MWPGCWLNPDHTIRIVVKTAPLPSRPRCQSVHDNWPRTHRPQTKSLPTNPNSNVGGQFVRDQLTWFILIVWFSFKISRWSETFTRVAVICLKIMHWNEQLQAHRLKLSLRLWLKLKLGLKWRLGLSFSDLFLLQILLWNYFEPNRANA